MASGLTRSLWAFTWLRWRMLVNSLTSAQRRDALERVSRVAALIVPGMFVATAFSSVLAAVAAGAYAGWTTVAHPVNALTDLTILRVFLMLVTVFAVLMPLFVGVHGGAGRVTRVLLLPISRHVLHFIEASSSLTDPWVVFAVPGLLAYAGGLIAGGFIVQEPWLRDFRFVGFVALAAGIGMALVIASVGSVVGLLVSWLVRDRRRGEIFVLVFVVGLSSAAIVPAWLSRSLEEVDDAGHMTGRVGGSWVMGDLPTWSTALPSELYGAAVTNSLPSSDSRPWIPLAGLFGEGLLLYGISSAVHRRIVESVETGRTRRKGTTGVGRLIRVPGMWPGTSAVAVAQLRTALRSVRGRLAILLPGPIVATMAVAFSHVKAPGAAESVIASRGYFAFGAGVLFALYAAQAFTMNQFGSDRSGLTREFLAPIRDIDLVRGKAVGCGIIIAAGALLSLACSLATAPGGSLLLWIATAMGGVAAFMIMAPATRVSLDHAAGSVGSVEDGHGRQPAQLGDGRRHRARGRLDDTGDRDPLPHDAHHRVSRDGRVDDRDVRRRNAALGRRRKNVAIAPGELSPSRAGALTEAWARDLAHELVAHAVHGEDVLRLLGIRLDFLAEPGHVHVDRPGRRHRVIAPHFVQEFVAAERRLAMLDEVLEQQELAG